MHKNHKKIPGSTEETDGAFSFFAFAIFGGLPLPAN